MGKGQCTLELHATGPKVNSLQDRVQATHMAYPRFPVVAVPSGECNAHLPGRTGRYRGVKYSVEEHRGGDQGLNRNTRIHGVMSM